MVSNSLNTEQRNQVYKFLVVKGATSKYFDYIENLDDLVLTEINVLLRLLEEQKEIILNGK